MAQTKHKARSEAVKEKPVTVKAEEDAAVVEAGTPSPVKPTDAIAIDARSAIGAMSASELEAFEDAKILLVRHVPGILGAIAARRKAHGIGEPVGHGVRSETRGRNS